MDAKRIVIYTLGGIVVLTGIGVGIYFLLKPVSVEKIDTTKNMGGGAGGNQLPPTSTNTSTNTSTGSTVNVTPNDVTPSANLDTSPSEVQDTPAQIAYDIATYGYSDQLPSGDFPLVLASKNKLVWDVQTALINLYGSDIVADGNMGEETTSAICSKVFEFCISANPVHRKIKVDKQLYDDILAGKKRYDLFLPTT